MIGDIRDYQQIARSATAGRPINVSVVTNYPVAEPVSSTVNRALQLSAAMGRY